jgi:hypothetical protein
LDWLGRTCREFGAQKDELGEVRADNDIQVLVKTSVGQLIDLEEAY